MEVSGLAWSVYPATNDAEESGTERFSVGFIRQLGIVVNCFISFLVNAVTTNLAGWTFGGDRRKSNWHKL